MSALSSENCSFQYQFHPTNQPLDGNCLLFLIILGKILLNILTLGMKRKNTYQNFMEYFCISLTFIDLLLLASISTISYFQDFVLLGMRFTKYHICLFTQIISCTYGFLYYPVFSIACMDYYCLNFSKTTKLPLKCQKLFYIFTVILIWISTLAYVLGYSAIYPSLETRRGYSYQCPFYSSMQSYWLSFSMVMVLCMAFITSCSEIITLVQGVRITSYMNETILYFPSSHSGYTVNTKKTLLPKFIICFLGTWLPFVFLQIIILLLKVQIPAYIEMNVPWLYFVNSFLIASVYWFNCHKLNLRAIALTVDPFVNWKCCFIPFTIHNLEHIEKPISIIIC